MPEPANTISYFAAGYGFIFVTMLSYLISLFVRRRNLQQDIQLLKEMEEKDDRPETAQATHTRAAH